MIRSKAGPQGTGFLERIEFAPVRVSAALRRKGDEAALELAARIDDLLGSLSERAASGIPAQPNCGPPGSTPRAGPGPSPADPAPPGSRTCGRGCRTAT